jgi:hypothetical protein
LSDNRHTMGWDVSLNRKLAVPLALGKLEENHQERMERSRILRESHMDSEDLRMLMQLADNRIRIEKLKEDIESDPEMDESDELKNDLDYINTSIQLGLLEITGELEEIQSAEEIFEEATA